MRYIDVVLAIIIFLLALAMAIWGVPDANAQGAFPEPVWECVAFLGCWFVPDSGTGAGSWQWVAIGWREDWWKVRELWHQDSEWHYITR